MRIKGYIESDFMSDIDGRESTSRKAFSYVIRFGKLEEFQITNHCRYIEVVYIAAYEVTREVF